MSGPNMDYCKFQNTLRALEQCVENDEIYKRQIEEDEDEDEDGKPMVTADESYRKQLIELCQEIARNTED